MPDRATMQAARPKCPGPLKAGVHEGCGLPMRWTQAEAFWTCPKHGNALTPQALLARQAEVGAWR